MASNLGSGRFFREHIVIRGQDTWVSSTKYWLCVSEALGYSLVPQTPLHGLRGEQGLP